MSDIRTLFSRPNAKKRLKASSDDPKPLPTDDDDDELPDDVMEMDSADTDSASL